MSKASTEPVLETREHHVERALESLVSGFRILPVRTPEDRGQIAQQIAVLTTSLPLFGSHLVRLHAEVKGLRCDVEWQGLLDAISRELAKQFLPGPDDD